MTTCETCGAQMRVHSRFRFDHEPGDSEQDAESLRYFEKMGLELGADVTLWNCARCDIGVAEFDYGDSEEQ
jgi:hypothetical protein